MRSANPSANKKGADLEKRVAAYYEGMGFRVSHNLSIQGRQIDLVASRDVPGLGIVKIMVEAKYRASNCGAELITDFANTAARLIDKGHVSGAAFVTNTDFTKDARATIDTSDKIRLLTLRDIEQEVFNASDSLLSAVLDYESQDISKDYIPLRARSESGSRFQKDLAEYVCRICKTDERLLIVCGDFGSGKTTLLERAFIIAARSRVDDASARFPIFLRLRSFLHYPDLWSFVSAELRDNQYIAPPKRVFDEKLKAGKLIVFLDGFDEIRATATAKNRGQFLATLFPLFNSRSPCILSTRPTYFTSRDEMMAALQAKVGRPRHLERVANKTDIYTALNRVGRSIGLQAGRHIGVDLLDDIWTIEPLEEGDVLQYVKLHGRELRKVTGRTPKAILQFISKIYDLRDLVRRPLQLKMIIQTVLHGLIDVRKTDQVVGPATLYEAYTQLSFARDNEKNATPSLPPEDRRIVCQYLALAMIQKDTLELTNDEVRKSILDSGVGREKLRRRQQPALAFGRVSTFTAPFAAEDLEGVLTGIRVGSFLSFGRDGSLTFAHKSYLEFFVAQFLYQAALEDPDALSRIDRLPLSREVFQFLGSYARENREFAGWLSLRLRFRPARSAFSQDNALRAAFAGATIVSGEKIAKVEIADVDLTAAQVRFPEFEDVTLKDVRIATSTISNWNLKRSVLERSTVDEVQFLSCNIDIEARHSKFAKLFVKSGGVSVRGTGWSIADSSFEDARVRISGTGAILGGVFRNCSVLLGGEIGQPTFEIQRGSIASIDNSQWFHLNEGIHISQCLIAGLIVPLEAILSILTGAANPFGPTNRGIIFVDGQSARGTLKELQVSESEWTRKFGKTTAVDWHQYQRVVLMQKGRRAGLVEDVRAESLEFEKGASKEHSFGGELDAVKVVLQLCRTLQKRGWTKEEAFSPLLQTLVACKLLPDTSVSVPIGDGGSL